MRRPCTLATAIALLTLTMTPSAAANDDEPAETCPAPHVEWDYDAERFAAWATVEASGCPAREQRQWALWLSITRYEDTSVHGVGRDAVCGPFPSSPRSKGRRYSCDVDVSFDHRQVEQASYEVQLGYPGAEGQETAYVDVVCVSGEAGAGCELEDDTQ